MSASGAERIAAERQRQIEVEGWTPEHDDEHDHGDGMGEHARALPRVIPGHRVARATNFRIAAPFRSLGRSGR